MERISVTVRLNGIPLQLDEAAYQRLDGYLADASRTLAGNPDREEILGDLERAIVDKCARRLQPPQAVATLAELQPALEEIGSVQDAGPDVAADDASRPPPRTAGRRLEQVSEGALISGVCQGFARYFGVDVILLRVVALLLLFATGGGMILVYLALMLLMPYAPRVPGGAPVRWLPTKSREFVEFLRAKFSTATG